MSSRLARPCIALLPALTTATFLACVFMCGCMTVPLGTMMKMASYDEADYLKIDPAEIRLRITSDKDAPLIIKKARLDIEGETKDGRTISLIGTLALENEERLQPKRSFLWWGYEPKRMWVLRLDDAGIVAFKTLQTLHRGKVLKKMNLHAGYEFEGIPEGAKIVVDLRLSTTDGYFTLSNSTVSDKPKLSSSVGRPAAEPER